MAAFRDMDDSALLSEFLQWDHKVKTATSWGAGLMQAAKCRDACGRILANRGLMRDFEPCIRREPPAAANTRPLFCKKYGFRMAENCGECIQPDPCYRIDCFSTAPSPQTEEPE
jgi:hypothetical protein